MQIQDLLLKVERKVRINRRLYFFISIFGALGYLGLVVQLLWDLYPALSIIIGACLLLLSIAAIAWKSALFRKDSPFEAAKALDTHFKTKDRVTAFVELTENSTDKLATEKITLVKKQLSEIAFDDPKQVVPFAPSGYYRTFALSTPFIWGIFIYLLIASSTLQIDPPSLESTKQLETLLSEEQELPEKLREILEKLLDTLKKEPLQSSSVSEVLSEAKTILAESKEELDTKPGAKVPNSSNAQPKPEKDKEKPQQKAEPTPSPIEPPQEEKESPKDEEQKAPEDKEQQEKSEQKEGQGKKGKESKQDDARDGDGKGQGKDGKEGSGDGKKSAGEKPGTSDQGQAGQDKQAESKDSGTAGAADGEKNQSAAGEKNDQADSLPKDDKDKEGNQDSQSKSAESLDKAAKTLDAIEQKMNQAEKPGAADSQSKGDKDGDKNGEPKSPNAGSDKNTGAQDQKSAKDEKSQKLGSKNESQQTTAEPDKKSTGDGQSKDDQDSKGKDAASTGPENPHDDDKNENKIEPSSEKALIKSPLDQSEKGLKPFEGGQGTEFKGERGFKDSEVTPPDEKFDSRFADGRGNTALNPEEAKSKITLEEMKLARPEPLKEDAEQPIPLEYRDILE